MCLRYRSGSKGHGCKGVLADGNAQFDSYGTHGYTRPLSSSTDCADAVAGGRCAVSLWRVAVWRKDHGRRESLSSRAIGLVARSFLWPNCDRAIHSP